jgi:hypothetical protein
LPGLSDEKVNAFGPSRKTALDINSPSEDQNLNGKWDTGDYWKHLQPEKIYTYSGEITLRANWDLELEMKIGVAKRPLTNNN